MIIKMDAFFIVMMLLTPGMEKPVVNRAPVSSFEECLAKVATFQEQLGKHKGEAYQLRIGCEVEGQKSDPA